MSGRNYQRLAMRAATLALGSYLTVGAPGIYHRPEISDDAKRLLVIGREIRQNAYMTMDEPVVRTQFENLWTEYDSLAELPGVREEARRSVDVNDKKNLPGTLITVLGFGMIYTGLYRWMK